jgi:nucleoid-associated protein YgaU
VALDPGMGYAYTATNDTAQAGNSKEATMPDQDPDKPDFSDVISGSSSTAPSAQAQQGGPAPAAGGRSYSVQPGDSLSKIAKKFYGNANDWKRIFEANRDRIKNPDLIQPGWTLKIPE